MSSATVIDLATRWRKILADGTVIESCTTATPIEDKEGSEPGVSFIVKWCKTTRHPDGKVEEESWEIPKRYRLDTEGLKSWTFFAGFWIPENPILHTYTPPPPVFVLPDTTPPNAEPGDLRMKAMFRHESPQQ